MSLSLRLALMLTVLFLALAGIGALGLQRLADGLKLALVEGASEAGQRVIRVLTERNDRIELRHAGTASATAPADSSAPTGPSSDAPLRVFIDGRELAPEQAAELAAAQPLPPLALAALHAERAERGSGAVRLEVRALSMAGQDPGLWIAADGVGQAIPLPGTGLERALGDFTRHLAWGMGGLLLLGLLVAVWLAHRVAHPLRDLAVGAARLGAGERGVRVADGGVGEVRATIAAFNRMAGELERLDAEAQRLRGHEALAELGEIGRGLAHSLRNPLHALGLCVEALQAEARAPQAAADLARAAREQISRLDGSLRGFLALSAGADAPLETIALRDVIDDVLLEARQTWGERVRFAATGDLHASLPAVRIELRILLHSLVTNAAEASPPGGLVAISVVDDDVLHLHIDDQGAGVPSSLRPRLFEPHVSNKAQGAGMGLYLARRLAVLRYRGDVSLEDRAEGGTRASLRLHPRQSA